MPRTSCTGQLWTSTLFRSSGGKPCNVDHGCHRSGNGQGKKTSSRPGKCQGILFWVRENWNFEEKSGKIEIVILI